MVGSSKILTVSYGTFSCTLEGFDDSFSTMKAIAEYFRDLAADDRYFGAEPPTPDAEMLARIAEREIARRVEARSDGSGIVLRAGTALTAPRYAAEAATVATPAAELALNAEPATAPKTDVQPEPAQVSPAAVAPRAEPEAAPAPVVAPVPVAEAAPNMPPAPVPPAAPVVAAAVMPKPVARPEAEPERSRPVAQEPVIPAHPDADSVAAKLQRIRAVVGKASTQMTTDDYAEDLTEAVLTEPADPWAEDLGDEDGQDQADLAALDGLPSLADASGDEDLSDQDSDLDMAAFEEDDLEDNLYEDEAYDEDAEDDMLVEEPAAVSPAAAEFDLGALQASLNADDDADDLGLAEDHAALAEDDTAQDDDETDILSTIAASLGTDSVPADAPEVAPAAPIRARVIRMKRADFERAVAKGDLMAESDTDDDVEDKASLPDLDGLDEYADLATDARATLSADEEAALMEELAEVERDATTGAAASIDDDYSSAPGDQDDDDLPLDDDDEDAAVDDDEPEMAIADEEADDDLDLDDEDSSLFDEDEDDVVAPAAMTPGRAALSRHPEADEAGMSRILSQTDAQMREPDGSRRRQAIAQLKAAVAATEAARRMGEKPHSDNRAENAFRDDLNQVVRPRRAERPVGPPPRPEARSERPRPAPLKLVASQRVDMADVPRVPATPVQPRRVAVEPIRTATTAPTSGAESFADFAERVGATGLADLLEAAAAYTSFVEGLEDFSRPQIMKQVQHIAPDEFSREDGLRSFGILLREGRIAKVRNGRFQVSDQTRFRPEPRAARG